MKKMLRNNSVIIKSFFVVISATFLVMMAVHAWQEPGSPPPGGNVNPPLHQGNTVQTKTGGLNVMGNVGIGTATPTNILSLGNAADRTFWIENSASGTVGRALTVAAGGTVAGGTDISGGNLILQSGLGTGTGASTISFQTGTTLATGTTLQTTSTKMTILGNGNVGIGTTSPEKPLQVAGAIRTNRIGHTGQYIDLDGGDVSSIYLSASSGVGAQKSLLISNLVTSGEASSLNNIRFRVGAATSPITAATIDYLGNVGIGTTAPTSKLQVVGLPEYADNAAATAGGLTAGAFYRTSTGVLMVVY
jgi:hypothetical protein